MKYLSLVLVASIFSVIQAKLGDGTKHRKLQTCEICSPDNKDKPETLTLVYKTTGKDSMYQDSNKASCRAGTYPANTTITVTTKAGTQSWDNVYDGVQFTIIGGFDAETNLYFSNLVGGGCYMHTSCSVPLVAGDTIGPFYVVGGNECTQNDDGTFSSGLVPADNSNNCPICGSNSNDKTRPGSITAQYLSTGKTSMFQGDKSTCGAKTYAQSQTLTVENKEGVMQTFSLMDGDIFTISGPFDANTVFTYQKDGDCIIHTSCSKPLVVGDQLGPLLLLAGNSCNKVPDGSVIVPPLEGPPVGGGDGCKICGESGKTRPSSLLIRYVPVSATSNYQDENKASCVGGVRYADTQTITVTNKIGVTQVYTNINGGDTFEVQGAFDAATTFTFSDGNPSCFIHTSCSQPLVVGDQIGPFLLLGGNDCDEPPPDTPDETPVVCVHPPNDTAETCEICSPDNKDKPETLTLRYDPNGVNSMYQDSNKASCRAGTYPSNTTLTVTTKAGTQSWSGVSGGAQFTIQGPFSADTTFYFSQFTVCSHYSPCFIHTSCSAPLIAGDQIGPFIVVGGNECVLGESGSFTDGVGGVDDSDDCSICGSDGKEKPGSLTFQYLSTGKNSLYQADKTTCVAGTYAARQIVSVSNKEGTTQRFNVTSGDIFTVSGPFSANTDFSFSSDGSCEIHTSCSRPLIVGDQFGPLLLLSGNDCNKVPPGSVITPPIEGPPYGGGGGCQICGGDDKTRPQSLVIRYIPVALTSNYQDKNKASCVGGKVYASNQILTVTNKNGDKQSFEVSEGKLFEILGPFDAATTFSFSDGSEDCFIHTSCSQPLVIGDQIGPFLLMAGNDCDQVPPGEIITPPITPPFICDEECIICDKNDKTKPNSLTIEYNPDGKNSKYQDSSKASCTAGSYPSNPTITMTNKEGYKQTFTVGSGDVFTIVGPFSANSEFSFNGGSECTIHTSCSAPLVVGDQIGPFFILAGNDCKIAPHSTPPPTPPPALPPPTLPTPLPTATPPTPPTPTAPTPPTFPTPPPTPTPPTPTPPTPTPPTPTAPTPPTAPSLPPFDQQNTPPPTNPPNSGMCEICTPEDQTQPEILVFQYEPTSPASSMFQGNKASCSTSTFQTSGFVTVDIKNGPSSIFNLNDGTVFTVAGPFTGILTFTFENGKSCTITTSCAVKLVQGDQVGPFVILGGGGCNPPPIEEQKTVPPEVCVICSPKDSQPDPDSITIVYKSDGEDAVFMDSDFVTCGAGTYPAATTLVVFNALNEMQVITVSNGEAFTINGPFKPNTEFMFSNGKKCSIDLSCDTPVVAGDQPGPFLITTGNGCQHETLSPTSTPTISPSRSPSEPPSPAPTTASPTGGPTPAPSSAPSTPPSLSAAPTKTPCIEVDKVTYVYGEIITVTYNIYYGSPNNPLGDGWICVYPCATEDYFFAQQWQCGAPPNCVSTNESGQATMGTAMSLSTGTHPIVPFYLQDGSINNCFKAIVIQDISSVGGGVATAQPYVGEECISENFEVVDPECP